MNQRVRVVIIGIMLVVWNPLATMAASKVELDVQVPEALERFYEEIPTGKALADKAHGVLIFPSVIKAGFGIGGEYGEGALLVGGQIADYYSVASASIGFQLGVQVKTQILLFMNDDVLTGFRQSDGDSAPSLFVFSVKISSLVAHIRTKIPSLRGDLLHSRGQV